jgi:hypothetical protein
MPYKKLEDANPAIKGIKPAVSLAQANKIAAMADAIAAEDSEVKSPWAVAISRFKETHTVRKRKWVTRESLKQKGSMQELESEGVEGHLDEISEHAYEVLNRSTYGATSFDELDTSREMDEKTMQLKGLVNDLKSMLDNIAFSFAEGDKVGKMRGLFDDFISRAEEVLSDTESDMPTEDEDEGEEDQSPAIEMKESYASEITMLEEAGNGSEGALTMMVKPIVPGWGNKRDNNYYSREMLKANGQKFVGAKMYETDHRGEEKNTRTWVSTIKSIEGFDKDGAPIAKVIAHHPDFIKRILNLSEAGILNKMECSIYGSALGEADFVKGGRKGRRIRSIEEIESVDWVTRAGAGGHVVGLAEKGAKDPMSEETKINDDTQVEEGAQEGAIVNVVNISEQKPPEDKSPEEPQMLAESDVRETLDGSKLPAKAKERLGLVEYETVEKLEEAIQDELDYIAEFTGSGQVTDMAETTHAAQVEMSEKQMNDFMDKANAKYI